VCEAHVITNLPLDGLLYHAMWSVAVFAPAFPVRSSPASDSLVWPA
jgi:hypothetical protein